MTATSRIERVNHLMATPYGQLDSRQKKLVIKTWTADDRENPQLVAHAAKILDDNPTCTPEHAYNIAADILTKENQHDTTALAAKIIAAPEPVKPSTRPHGNAAMGHPDYATKPYRVDRLPPAEYHVEPSHAGSHYRSAVDQLVDNPGAWYMFKTFPTRQDAFRFRGSVLNGKLSTFKRFTKAGTFDCEIYRDPHDGTYNAYIRYTPKKTKQQRNQVVAK